MDFLGLMRAVWNDSLDGIVISDPETHIIDVNPSYCRLTGFTREQLIGAKTRIVSSGLTPRPVFAEMWRSLGETGLWVGELINRRPDGALWISYLSITRVLDENGQVAAYVGIARDLTERRNLEEQLRQQSTRLGALLEAITSGVAMFDNNDRCVLVNRNLARLLNREVTDLVGRTRQELQAQLASYFHQEDVLAPETPAGRRTVTTRGPAPRYFMEMWGPVVASDQTTLGRIFTFRDITRETEVDRMKSEFIATVSHELRTPMTSIKGALGLLLGGAAGPVPEAQQELLRMAQNNIDRLIRLVNDILDLSRIESGRLELRPTPINLNDSVALAVRELDHLRQQKELHLRTQLAPNLPPVMADPDRIGQVLTNLLGNAYKFTDPGGTIIIRTAAAGGEVRVQVQDNGPGIPADQLESIFARFTRASTAASRKAGGTGLGLAIARAIVEEHGGRIWAESQLGQGATVSFALPARPDQPLTEQEELLRPEGLSLHAAEAPTVLVCDDDPDLVRLLTLALEQEGFRVIGVTSGAEALAVCRSGRVDCVALDLLMPGMHGLEVARRLKEDPNTRHIPVVVVSAYSDEHRSELALLGVAGVVPKPVDQRLLLTQLAAAVGEARGADGPPEVLVVDDDPTMRRVMELTLQEAGYKVRTAADGMAAFTAVQERRPDLLVLDILMPNVDGFRLVRMLQSHPQTRNIPLLVLTALDLTEAERGVLHLGPTAHLAKGPRLRAEVVRRVRELLGHPR